LSAAINIKKGVKIMKKNYEELLYQALETEVGGVEVYTTALECVVNEDLKEEWTKYLEQTKTHVEIVESVFADLGA
jgi:rubrerythrin